MQKHNKRSSRKVSEQDARAAQDASRLSKFGERPFRIYMSYLNDLKNKFDINEWAVIG